MMLMVMALETSQRLYLYAICCARDSWEHRAPAMDPSSPRGQTNPMMCPLAHDRIGVRGVRSTVIYRLTWDCLAV